MKALNSHDLYIDFPAGKVVEIDVLEDVGCGIYPCYYYKQNKKLYASTSVTELIRNLGDFRNDLKFSPTDFYNNPPIIEKKQRFKNIFENLDSQTFIKRKSKTAIYVFLKKMSKWISFDLISYLFGIYYIKQPAWYDSYRTIDKRIKKLKPFEKRTTHSTYNNFKPNYSITKKEIILKKTAELIAEYVQTIEQKYPDYHHVILTAGKDSQLIWLAPKLNSKSWSCFSAEPNAKWVKKWLGLNNIAPAFFFDHSNLNDETLADFKKKILCSDLYSDLSHIRWMPRMIEIAEKFNNKCVFWGGTAADAIYKHYPEFHESKNTFFELHMNRVACFQGNYHQVFKNYTGLAYLSPYHSEDIWKSLYQEFDPLFIKQYDDVRKELGDLLSQRKIIWLDENPSPSAYEYQFQINPIDFYLDTVKSINNG